MSTPEETTPIWAYVQEALALMAEKSTDTMRLELRLDHNRIIVEGRALIDGWWSTRISTGAEWKKLSKSRVNTLLLDIEWVTSQLVQQKAKHEERQKWIEEGRAQGVIR